MKEYRVVCDRKETYQNGKSEVAEGTPPVDERGRLDHSTFDTPETADYWLTYAKERYAQRTTWGPNKIRQCNFRIQEREVTDWRDEK